MRDPGKKQALYILTREDGDRIDHLIGVLSMAITELLLSKRIHIPHTPDLLAAENQLMDEKNDISGELTQSGVDDY